VELADLGAARRREVTAAWLALIATILTAGAAQRITGLGFALIATPVALVVLGTQAVPFVAVIGALSSVVALAATWRLLQPRAIAALSAVTLVAMVPALLLARSLNGAMANVVAGGLVIAATIIVGVRMTGPALAVVGSPVAAGMLTGVSAAFAGLGGPAAAAHGAARRWGDSFVPNLQVVLLLTVPFVVLGHGWPTAVPLPLFLAAIVAVGAGALLGGAVRHRIPPAIANWLTRCVALTGGIVALVSGISAL